MFENFRRDDEDGPDAKPAQSSAVPRKVINRRLSTRDAFHAFSHRRSSWLSRDEKEWRPRFRWHIYENNGSYNGWFDWLPLWMRVGYWSPVAVIFLAVFYGSMYQYMPQPLDFPAIKTVDDFWWKADCFVFIWGIAVILHGRYLSGMESLGAFYISYTGWSWIILTARAGLEAASPIMSPFRPELAMKMAVWGSSLRFPASIAAFVTFTIWNLILLPILYFKATPPGEKRKNFLKFNCSFFMINVHVLNLPLAIINNVYGSNVRLFSISDLWVGYLIVAMYSVLYLFVMDRIGLHFYPIFCPRSATCAISFGAVLFLYFFLMQRGNDLIMYLNPELKA